MDRRARILGDIDLSCSRGLEIGPRHAPLVGKHESDVRYVDYGTVEQLRADWTKPEVLDPASFVDVDIVWGEAPLAAALPQPVDYVVASHVIEHVPDLVGWLDDLRAALKPEGQVCLAIPDRRFTFDLFRAETGLAEVVEAYVEKRRRPSVRQVFDALSRTRPNNPADAWASDPTARLAPMPEKLLTAFETARGLVEAPRYFDTHCWVFTPRSFLEIAQGLHRLGLWRFRIAHFAPTAEGELEFYVRLSPADGPAIDDSLAAAWAGLAAAPVPPEERRP